MRFERLTQPILCQVVLFAALALGTSLLPSHRALLESYPKIKALDNALLRSMHVSDSSFDQLEEFRGVLQRSEMLSPRNNGGFNVSQIGFKEFSSLVKWRKFVV